jgi:hypothetical protein
MEHAGIVRFGQDDAIAEVDSFLRDFVYDRVAHCVAFFCIGH